MRYILTILSLLFFCNMGFAYNPFWVNKDKKLISAITRLDKFNPRQVEAYFKNQDIQKAVIEKEDLGFGWKQWKTWISPGYISISAIFYYYSDSLVSYSITPGLPEEKLLLKKYKKWYSNYFQYNGQEIEPFKLNEAVIMHPLREYGGNWNKNSGNLLHYMSPLSGTMYGYAGGGFIMQNRKAFLEIKDSLTKDQLVLLMYSINPASRLTAIEYYLQQYGSAGWLNDIGSWTWIIKNFKMTPTVKTMWGCSVETEDIRVLFPEYYNLEYLLQERNVNILQGLIQGMMKIAVPKR
jgi:hypothetical protein